MRLENLCVSRPGVVRKAALGDYTAVKLTKCLVVSQLLLAGPGAGSSYVTTYAGKGHFPLVEKGRSVLLCATSRDYPGVIRVLRHLQADIERVTGYRPAVLLDTIPEAPAIVVVGTLGRHPLIDRLAKSGKLHAASIMGRWEAFAIQAIEEPLPGVRQALVIAGSDKRGTIFGMFDLSQQIGVSPWYWWADVPPKRKEALYILPGAHVELGPKVKYRGIFINDEAPALSGWAYETFGGFNHHFYEKVFELILRLKGNFLWPAMWGRAFYDDDPENPRLADEYGVVISTSHHEPMMRAHDEWRRYGSGPWNYALNQAKLQEFWREGIRRMGSYESIVTIGMRGDGDEPMSEETNIALLERIVQDQRRILEEVTGKKATDIPQVWALYKEVQDYYDRGMRVPDDVTLLLCDDNWGNIRRLPKPDAPPRAGGYGIYYHYDYVGGPRNYKWLNTNQIARVWEQMHLAYEHGARQIWIVNVGDIKPMEFPIDFFLDYAWDPERIGAEDLPAYVRSWAEEQFGSEHAAEIATFLTKYTTYNSRRKPELLAPTTYSLMNYREAERVVADYTGLEQRARRLFNTLPTEYRDAFYQLVLHPIEACANLNRLYVTVGKNHLYARQGRASTNALAKARELFQRDAEITHYYNKVLADGKWNHMMDQTHIGYTSWQQPETNIMPEVKEIPLREAADMGVAIEGSESWWPGGEGEAVLPEFDPFHRQSYYIEVFNRGKQPFHFSARPAYRWLRVSPEKGTVVDEQRLWVTVDWRKAPTGRHRVPITISGPSGNVVVIAPVFHPHAPRPETVQGFVESNGYIAIEAEHYTTAVTRDGVGWQRIPDLGRTFSAMTPFPVTAPRQVPGGSSPHLAYAVYLFTAGEAKVKAYLSPTLDYYGEGQQCYGVSFDDQPVQIVNIHEGRTFQDWEESVRNNVTVTVSRHTIDQPGQHVLKLWVVDPGVVVQRLVVETGKVRPSYLGPPESYYGSGSAR